jgi:hypothetical protein
MMNKLLKEMLIKISSNLGRVKIEWKKFGR